MEAYIHRKATDKITTRIVSQLQGEAIYCIHLNQQLIGYAGDYILMAYDASQPVGGFDEDGTFEEDAIIKYTDRKTHVNDGIFFGGDAFMNVANSILGAREHIDSCVNCTLINKKQNTATTSAATSNSSGGGGGAVSAVSTSFNPVSH